MTIVDMLNQSLILTLLGMGVVFSFLIILIVCMTIAQKVIHAMKLDKDVTEPAAGSATIPSVAPVPSAVSAAVPGQDTAVVAAIAAVLHEKQS